MVAKGGTKLINNEAIKILKKKLMKKILLITPNIPEAEILTNTKINSLKI
jgi:hydroxymethylpyrimidine/phosphomethylpyrimidine kinase